MKKISLFVLSFIIWLLLVWKFDYQNILVGFVVAVIVSLLLGELGEHSTVRVISIPGRLLKLIWYLIIAVILWLLSALEYIGLILSPELNSGHSETIIMNKKIELKNMKSVFLLMMILNLSPGILVINYKETTGEIVLNCLKAKEKKINNFVENMEKLVKGISE